MKSELLYAFAKQEIPMAQAKLSWHADAEKCVKGEADKLNVQSLHDGERKTPVHIEKLWKGSFQDNYVVYFYSKGGPRIFGMVSNESLAKQTGECLYRREVKKEDVLMPWEEDESLGVIPLSNMLDLSVGSPCL